MFPERSFMQLTRYSEPPTVICYLQVVKIQIPLHSFILSLKLIICNSLSHKEALGLVFLYCKTAIMSV